TSQKRDPARDLPTEPRRRSVVELVLVDRPRLGRAPLEPARAFSIFASHVRDWWDPVVFSPERGDASFVDLVLEARQGGRWFARTADGREPEWGRVQTSEPPSRLVIDWHPHGVSMRMEVTFKGPAPRRTDVTLALSGFEGFGEDAAKMRDIHDAKVASLLDRFAAFVNRHPAGQTESAAPHAVTDGETVLATMDIPTTPGRLFRALTTAECERWWGAPDTYRATTWKSDTRVGGRWSVDIRLGDGSGFPASGTYLEIDEPSRIVLTRRYDWDYPEFGRRDTRVTYLLDPIASGTRVTVRQDGFAGFRGTAEHHAKGWEGFLKYLATYLSTEVPQ
ncbi:MAG: SRPBCC family protein, partial [Solirubrobacteraceae bacterium]